MSSLGPVPWVSPVGDRTGAPVKLGIFRTAVNHLHNIS